MAYDIGDKLANWLEMMKDSTFFGCTVIDLSALPKDSYKAGIYSYVDEPEKAYVEFSSLIEVDPDGVLVSHVKGFNEEGEVILEVTGVSESGFYVKAPVPCEVYYLIGYTLPEDDVISGSKIVSAGETQILLQVMFNTPLPESTKRIVYWLEGKDGLDTVTVMVNEINRFGMKIQAPIACTVNYIVAYEN